MDIIFSIIFTICLNIPALIFLVTGIFILKDPKGFEHILYKKNKIIGILCVVIGISMIIHGLWTGYGLQ
jgi:uncharacterized membrane protein